LNVLNFFSFADVLTGVDSGSFAREQGPHAGDPECDAAQTIQLG
jgi:hypothetical protein